MTKELVFAVLDLEDNKREIAVRNILSEAQAIARAKNEKLGRKRYKAKGKNIVHTNLD